MAVYLKILLVNSLRENVRMRIFRPETLTANLPSSPTRTGRRTIR